MDLCRCATRTLIAALMLSWSVAATANTFTFSRHDIDTAYGGNGKPGWSLAGDVEGDGDIDIVAGGGSALFVYVNDGSESFTRHGSLHGAHPVGANGAQLWDVDGDGDLDVVSAKYESDVGWWENPTPSGGSVDATAWPFHVIDSGVAGWFLHDLIRADLDGDGDAEEFVANVHQGYWDAPCKLYWYVSGVDPAQPWSRHVVDQSQAGSNHSHAGLSAGDIDADGNLDIVFSQGWYEAPDDPSGAWSWHAVATDVYGISNAELGDMDGDADLDLVVAAGHHGTGVFWFERPADPIGGTWTKHTVDATLVNPEGLAVLDLDTDGDLDVVANDLDFDAWNQQVHNVYVIEQTQGAVRWITQTIAPDGYASHLLRPVDVNEDGLVDLVSEGCGYQIVTFHENTTPQSLIFVDGFESGSTSMWSWVVGGP